MKPTSCPHKKTIEKANSFRYLFTKFDKEGWANDQNALPIPFDLVTVLTNTEKKIPAWWNETKWEGVRLTKYDTVLKWRRRLYEHLT